MQIARLPVAEVLASLRTSPRGLGAVFWALEELRKWIVRRTSGNRDIPVFRIREK